MKERKTDREKNNEPRKPVRRTFAGPSGQKVALRVALERDAYAEITAHAKESLESEVCGVLAGEVCEDNEGLFVHVQAAVRGTAAKSGGTHVTFTQETWNRIHETLEHDHPKLQIVGWYHSHPGFGVEFSEMDRFIHTNFFPSPTHVALVTDPLGGHVALGINGADGLEYVERFWVDGREQKARVPAAATASDSGSGESAPAEWAESVEQRLSQLIHAVDEQRATHSRFLMTLFLLACLTAVVSIGYQIWARLRDSHEPPKTLGVVPVPVQIGDKTMFVLIGVAGWEVPPDMNAALVQLEKQKQLEKEKHEAETKAASATNATATATNAAPAGGKTK